MALSMHQWSKVMQHWLALLPARSTLPDAVADKAAEGAAENATEEAAASQQRALGWWALQFTPRVALLEEGVVAEVRASERLFGGGRVLRERIEREALELGCAQVAGASNGLAALALARCGLRGGLLDELDGATEAWALGDAGDEADPDGPQDKALIPLLDALPIQALSVTAAHEATLSQLGCHTLGALRKLPRSGLGRRFGKAMLAELDRAYGLRAQAYDWLSLPDVFDARLELPERIEEAPALMQGARRLLTQMSGWLTARHAGVNAFTLSWTYNFQRARDVAPGDAITIRTADSGRHMAHFCRLLSEHLDRLVLPAPVDEIRLHADHIQPLADHNASLLPDAQRQGESMQQLLERLSARLGDGKVLSATCRADHRPEQVQQWWPAHTASAQAASSCDMAAFNALPQPTWLLTKPLPLAMREGRPVYMGPLQLLAGPYRMEGGWWDFAASASSAQTQVARDYFVAASERAGLLWLYRGRMGLSAGRTDAADGRWYLHGIFG
jgi:protein ImuB